MRCRVPGLPRTAAAGTSHQRSRGTPASAQLAINCRRPARQRPTTHAATLWQWCCPQIGRAAPNLLAPGGRFTRRMLTGRAARAQYSARTRERRGERANWPPLTQPTVCVAWPSSAARRTQKAEKDAALRGVRARAGDDHRPRRIRRPRGHSVRCRAAVRRAVTRKITTHPSPAFVTLRLVTTVSPHSILSSPLGTSGPWRPQFSVSGARSWRDRSGGVMIVTKIACRHVHQRRDRTVNGLERRRAPLKIESQPSIDKELASIKRKKSGAAVVSSDDSSSTLRQRLYVSKIESAEESLRMMRACKSARPMCAPASPCQPRGRGGTFPRYSATAPSPFVACRVCFTRRSKRIPRTQRRGGRCGWTNKKKTLERVWAVLRARVQKCISFLTWTSTTAMRAAAVWAFCAEVVVVRPHLISKVGLRLPCCSHKAY